MHDGRELWGGRLKMGGDGGSLWEEIGGGELGKRSVDQRSPIFASGRAANLCKPIRKMTRETLFQAHTQLACKQ